MDSRTDAKLAGSRVKRALWVGLGTLCLGLGLVGLLLPVMPTTVFVLLAAYCYARSSPRLYDRLLRHPRFGPTIRRWQAQRAMPRWAKRVALTALLGGTAVGMLTVPSSWARAALALAAALLIAVLLRIPSYAPASSRQGKSV